MTPQGLAANAATHHRGARTREVYVSGTTTATVTIDEIVYKEDSMPIEQLTAQEVAGRAATIIEEGGLIKGALRDSWGRHCTRGAIVAVLEANDDWKNTTLLMATEQLVLDHINCDQAWGMFSFMDIPVWNNAPDRTAEEVIGALRGAAGERVADVHAPVKLPA